MKVGFIFRQVSSQNRISGSHGRKEGCNRTLRAQSQKQRRLKTGTADFAKAVFSDDVFIYTTQ